MGSVNNVSTGLTIVQIEALGNLLFAEPLIGAVDGVNKVFNTTYSFQTDRIYPYKNGQQLVSPDDFTETDDKEITFTFAPFEGDVMFAQYIRSDLNP